jgi:hypothetical protein
MALRSIRNNFLSGTFFHHFYRNFILPGMYFVGTFLQEPFIHERYSGNLSVTGAFFTGTLFVETFRWELFGRNVSCRNQPNISRLVTCITGNFNAYVFSTKPSKLATWFPFSL